MTKIPTGFVTFLFTDIEGSTKLAQQFPELISGAIEKHNSILRNAIESNNGFVFDIAGDAFCSSFEKAEDAVKAAVTIQKNLLTEKWNGASIKVRIGIHTGKAEWSGNNYMGYITLARTSRVMSAAYGEQILISNEVYQIARDNIHGVYNLRDLGDRRLKDLIQPIKLFQVSSKNIRTEFPPLKTLDARPNNLPVQLTSFIGRKEEFKSIKNLLKQTHLLTLTGSGGAGKTRLAMQIGAEMIDEFVNGVWIIELASLAVPELLSQTVMQILGIKEEARQSPDETLTNYLKDKEMLLILDNCEHLINTAAEFVHNLLTKNQKLKIIATSREALRCEGEHTHYVLPLEYPDPNDSESPEKLSQYESVRLFIERALSVNANFRVTNENAASLAQICFQLDGIPLAIELAAAKTKVLKTEQIYQRLDNRFNLLTGGKRTSLPRQQTLRALIDWSFDLLSDKEKILWSRLSVFSGGWTLQAAEQICSDEKIDEYDVLDLLSELAGKSIIFFNEADERYKMLETLRQYGSEKLKASGEFDFISGKHLDFYSEFVSNAMEKIRKSDSLNWLKKIDSENGNTERALNWYSENPSFTDGLKLISALSFYWQIRGNISEGTRWFEFALKMKAENNVREFGNIFSFAGSFARLRGEFDNARKLLNDSIEFWRENGNEKGVNDSLSRLGILEFDESNFGKAIEIYEQCLDFYRKSGDKLSASRVLNNMANAISSIGDSDRAFLMLQECLKIRRELGDNIGVSSSLDNLGVLAFENEDYLKAEELFRESLEIKKLMGNKSGVALSLDNYALVKSALGDFEAANIMFKESIEISRETGNKTGLAEVLNNKGISTLQEGFPEKAVEYFKESLEIGRNLKAKMQVADSCLGIGRSLFRLKNYEEAKKHYLESLDLYNEIGNEKDIVLNILLIAEIMFYTGDFINSAMLIGFSENYFKTPKKKIPHLEQKIFDDSGKKVKEMMSDKDISKSYEEGRSLKIDEALCVAKK